MSALDDLGDIADQCAYGTSQGGLAQRNIGKKPATMRCGSPDHMKGENIRVYRRSKNGKLRTVCRLCDRLRRGGGKARYGALEYPL